VEQTNTHLITLHDWFSKAADVHWDCREKNRDETASDACEVRLLISLERAHISSSAQRDKDGRQRPIVVTG
jgi:hypothetical protein